jgi:hypothetical protein
MIATKQRNTTDVIALNPGIIQAKDTLMPRTHAHPFGGIAGNGQ